LPEEASAVLNTLRSTAIMFLALTLVTGVAYPAIVTLLAQSFFPHQANGSLVYKPTEGGEDQHINIRDWWGASDKEAPAPIGSELIGQQFSSDRYFWSRPSATGPVPYNAAASTGSNYGPTNPAQLDAVKQRVELLRSSGSDEKSPVPVDLVTASSSGLDPHISPAAAEYQVPRIAKARGLGDYVIRRVVAENIEGRTFGLMGEPRVNVLRLNLALDQLKPGEE
jgi:K+-transporting ATPase ATPase C chain